MHRVLGVARVLVVEDDPTIGRVISSSLRSHTHEVAWVETGGEALSLAATSAFDLTLLDLGLPDMDGTEVCRRLRDAQPNCVIVMLTARADEIDVVVGLEAGADDYLTKPFRLAELSARVRAHLRRGPVAGATAAVQVLRVGELEVDLAGRRAILGEHEIGLRAKEFDLLARLVEADGSAVSRAQLMADVWDENWSGSTKTLDVHVSSLRRKLGAASGRSGARPPEIVTLRGRGFRLDAPEASSATPRP